jgi:hypothetical protein
MRPGTAGYRIDPDGWLYQRVRVGPRTPIRGERRLGRVRAIAPGLSPSGLFITYEADSAPAVLHQIGILRESLVDERAAPGTAAPRAPRGPIAGGADPPMVEVTVIDRRGPIALVEHPDGSRVYLVVCPHCQADLSTVSQGRLIDTPVGPLPEVWFPVRCPECKGALLPQPSAIVRGVPRGAPRQ